MNHRCFLPIIMTKTNENVMFFYFSILSSFLPILIFTEVNLTK